MTSTSEYRDRLNKVQEEMVEANLDGLLLHQPESIVWLTGFHTIGYFCYHAVIVPRTGDPLLVIRDVELPEARISTWVTAMVQYSDTVAYSNPFGTLQAAKRGVETLNLHQSRIGIEAHSAYLTLARYDTLKQALPGVEFVYEPRIVDRLRLIHSPGELEYIRSAARIVEEAMSNGLEAIREGVTEQHLAEVIDNTMMRRGGRIIDHVITSGERTNLIHGVYTDRVLLRGDIVYLELSGVVNHYVARLMRAAVIGEPTTEQEYAAEVLIRAQDAAIDLMKPGVDAKTIDDACRLPILESGIRTEYTNRVGYPLEANSSDREHFREFVPGADFTLEAGEVYHMLVMAAGLGFSETVLITDEGPEVITQFERQLFRI